MSERADLKPNTRDKFAHLAGFVLAGGTAFLTDVGVYELLASVLGAPALIARALSILTAMIVSWLINRTITFPMPDPPRIAEFLHFAALALVASLVNYGVFAVLLWLVPGLWAPAAILVSSLAAMILAYVNMRFSVFRQHDGA